VSVDAPVADLPTAAALVRLRFVAEDARRRADDTFDAGRHLALIALDGACEYALWLAAHSCGVRSKPIASVPDLYSALKQALGERWEIKGWAGVDQLHRARNSAQHAAVVPAPEQIPLWSDAAWAFIDSLCVAVFDTTLDTISLAQAVTNDGLRAELHQSEELIPDDPALAMSYALGAFEWARARWREQRGQRLLAPASAVRQSHYTGSDVGDNLQDINDFLEVQLFAGNPGEYLWLHRAREEHATAGWTPTPDDVRRVLSFVTDWIVRWEIFNHGYPVDRWNAHRDSIAPPIVGDGLTPQIVGARADFLPEVPGRPARCVLSFQLVNVPNRGRWPWVTHLQQAVTEVARESQSPSLFAEFKWFLSGLLLVHVDLSCPQKVVSDAVRRAVDLASKRYTEQIQTADEREVERGALEAEFRQLVASARSDDLDFFRDPRLVKDEWLGTNGWIVFIELEQGAAGAHELFQSVDIFRGARGVLAGAHARDGCIAFEAFQISDETRRALETAITACEEQVRHVRNFRSEQQTVFDRFAAGITEEFGCLSDHLVDEET
jgi:hypothetical protein